MIGFLDTNILGLILGALALLVAKEIYMFMRRGRLENKIDKIKLRVDELHRWQAVEDDDGVKLIYNRKELYIDALHQLSKVVSKNTEVLTALLIEIKVMAKAANH